MPQLHLHSYPRPFNDKGHLKVMPLRQSFNWPFASIMLISSAIYAGWVWFEDYTRRKYWQNSYFEHDREVLLIRKRAFETLVMGNSLESREDEVRSRSLF